LILQPALTNVHLDWGEFEKVTQTPQKLRTVFNGDNLIVYAFLDSSAQLGTVTLRGNAPEGPVSFSVTVDPQV
jgi:hypothetical protein